MGLVLLLLGYSLGMYFFIPPPPAGTCLDHLGHHERGHFSRAIVFYSASQAKKTNRRHPSF
jgi:hypothetical protein